MIAERQARPTDDLMSVLVHAEVDGEKLEEIDIVMGFFLLMAAGNDSTKATYCSGMRALMESPDQKRELIEDPTLIPAAVEEALRMFPAFAHFRRTATQDTELHGQKIKRGEKVVMWYVSSNRDETRYEDPDRFDIHRNPEHQAFGAGGRHFCLGTALARLELKVMVEETLKRYPGHRARRRARAGSGSVRKPAEDAAGEASCRRSEPLTSRFTDISDFGWEPRYAQVKAGEQAFAWHTSTRGRIRHAPSCCFMASPPGPTSTGG